MDRPTESGPAVPSRAGVVVIGAGIVGNCLVGHLAELGWDELVLIDKGPLPDPGGSTGHASNFIFPTDHNREIAMLTLESQRQYEALGVNTTCGGVEVARTEERMEELRRRMTSARSWGIETELLTPDEVVARVPFVNGDVIKGGFYTPAVSVVDSVKAGTIMRERARAKGVLTVLDNTEVTGLEVERRPFGRPRICAVATDRGTIEAAQVVIACGVWSPRIAAMAGANIPLTPAVHQMADMGPIDLMSRTGNEIGYPIVRDMDVYMYERQSHEAMEVGSYAHRPILVRPDDIPSLAEAERSPTEMPLTGDDFAPQLGHAREIMGELLAGSEMQYSVNGLLSLTPDTHQVLGETAEVERLWSAAAVWIKEGPGTARLIAEWITYGYPRLCDPHASDITRFYAHERTEQHIRGRCDEHFNKTYGIVHPREQWASERGMNRAPFHDRTDGPGRRIPRGARLGAAAVVRLQRRPGGTLRRPRPPARVGPALVVADQHRRAPAPAAEGGHRRPERVPDLRCVRPRCGALPGAPHGQQVRPPGRQLDLHAAAHSGRRHPRRPHHPASGRGPLPHRHRRLRRGA